MPAPLATAQKPLSCSNKLEYIPISLSQDIKSHVEVLDASGVDFHARWGTGIWFHSTCNYSAWSAPFAEDVVLFPMAAGVGARIWVLNSVPLISVSVFKLLPCSFYYCTMWYDLTSGIVKPPAVTFIAQIVLVFLDPLCFHMQLKTVLFLSSLKNCIRILMGVILTLRPFSQH